MEQKGEEHRDVNQLRDFKLWCDAFQQKQLNLFHPRTSSIQRAAIHLISLYPPGTRSGSQGKHLHPITQENN